MGACGGRCPTRKLPSALGLDGYGQGINVSVVRRSIQLSYGRGAGRSGTYQRAPDPARPSDRLAAILLLTSSPELRQRRDLLGPVTLFSDAAHARARLCDASHRVIGEENGDGTDHGDHEAVQI